MAGAERTVDQSRRFVFRRQYQIGGAPVWAGAAGPCVAGIGVAGNEEFRGGALRRDARGPRARRLDRVRARVRCARTASRAGEATMIDLASRARRVAVVALGGNALAPAGEPSTIYNQFRHTRESLAPIVELIHDGWNVCIVHGNGPQVGDELVRNEVAREEASPLPLGVLVAATAGWIGYMIQQSLENALMRGGLTRDVATVITQVQVDPSDPAIRRPTKF